MRKGLMNYFRGKSVADDSKSAPPDTEPRSAKSILASHESLLRSIEGLFLGERNHVYTEYFLPLAGRYAGWVLDLPASEFHHHAGTGGLFAHSLEVVLDGLKRFEQHLVQERNADGSLNGMGTVQRRYRWQYGVAVAGLFHDAGKVLDVEVAAAGELWNPIVEGMESFVRRHHPAVVQIRWKPGRIPGGHEVLNTLIAGRLIRPEDIALVGIDRWRDTWDALMPGPSPMNRIAPLIRGADRESTRSNLLDPIPPPVAAAGKDKASAILEALKVLLKAGELRANSRGSPMYILAQHTACVVPAILDPLSGYLKSQGVFLPQDNNRVYDLLQERGVLLARDGRSVLSLVVNPDGKKPYGLKVILIRNERLWGREVPARFAGTVEGLDVTLTPDVSEKRDG